MFNKHLLRYATGAAAPVQSTAGSRDPDELGIALDGLIAAVRAADQDGLVPADYHVDELDAARRMALDTEKAIDFDLRATYTYLRYASDLSLGTIDPEDLNPEWHPAPKSVYLRDALRALSGFGVEGIGPPGVETAGHGHRRQHVIQRRPILLRRCQRSKVICQQFLSYGGRNCRRIYSQPPEECAQKRLGVGAIKPT
jgi:hypothetical protein